MLLKTKIIITSGLLFLAGMAIQTVVSTTAMERNMIKEIGASIHNYARSNGLKTDEWIDSKKSLVYALKNAAEKSQTDQELLAHVALVKEAGNFATTLIGTTDGDTFSNNGKNSKAGYDPRTRPWYKTGLTGQGMQTSEPYWGKSTDYWIFSISERFSAPGKMSGVAASNVNLKEINEYLKKTQVPGEGFAFIVDDQGKFIAHPDEALNNKPMQEFSADLSTDYVTELAAGAEVNDVVINGTEYLASAYKLKTMPWTLVMLGKKSVMLAPVKAQLITQIIITVLLVVGSSIALIFLVRELLKHLTTVTNALKEIAEGEGDLTVTIDTKHQDEVGELATAFNQFVAKMHDIIFTVNQLSNQVMAQSIEAATDSEERQHKVKNQQDEVTQVATAMTEMSATTVEIASSAEQAAQEAQSAVGVSETGIELAEKSKGSINNLSAEVQNAKIVIADLSEQGEKITTIVSAINDIAEQTNLLALNAAIEAARAGEQGRGFAVVADEVRSLSQRTRSSTEEISEMIEQLQQTTNQAVEGMNVCHNLANESVEDANLTAHSFNDINSATLEIDNMATGIATAAEQQAVTSEEINTNTESIKVISDNLISDAVEGTHKAQELKALSEQLLEQVNKFVVRA